MRRDERRNPLKDPRTVAIICVGAVAGVVLVRFLF